MSPPRMKFSATAPPMTRPKAPEPPFIDASTAEALELV